MKTTIKNLSKLLLVAITIFSMSMISSCSKDGEPGAAGKDGVNGTNGTNGQTGTANVIYSNWINQNWNTENGLFFKIMDITEPKITIQIINNGLVLGFWRFSDQNYVYSLPLLFNEDSRNLKREMAYFENKVRFTSARFNNSLIMSDLWLNGSGPTSISQYRYIIIPEGVSASGRGITPPDYSKMSYHEVCAKFNIPE